MLERVSEPISNPFAVRLGSADVDNIILCDFYNESQTFRGLIGPPSANFNFNYQLSHLQVSYKLLSLAPKPFQEYKLSDTEFQKRAKDIEFARQYNESTTDSNNKYYANKLTISIRAASVSRVIAEILLYNNLVTLHLPLMPFLGSPIMPKSGALLCSLSFLPDSDLDAIIISGSYTGNMNYTFGSNTQTHNHIFV